MSNRANDQITNPERALWQEVLFRAILDARLDPDDSIITGNQAHEVMKARLYLTRPSKDLSMVCSLAGMDMEAVIERIRKRVADAAPVDPDVKPPAKTPRQRSAVYSYNGRCLTIRQWSEVAGLSVDLLSARLRKGWPIAQALTMPKGEGRRRVG